MSEDFGPTFITVTDEDGQEIVLEFIDALEHNGQLYQAFSPLRQRTTRTIRTMAWSF